MGRRSRKRERTGEPLQGDLLGESSVNVVESASPPLSIEEGSVEAPMLHTSGAREALLETPTPDVVTTAPVTVSTPPTLAVDGVPAVPEDESSVVASVELGTAPAPPPPDPALGAEPQAAAPTLQIVSATHADTTEADSKAEADWMPVSAPVTPAPPPLPTSAAKHAAPSLTLEPPPSRAPAHRGGRRATGQSEARPTRTRRQEPDSGEYADTPASAKKAASDGRAANGSTHDAAARPRPAGEPLARARALVEQRKIQEAIELYLGILTVNPSNLKARNNLGVLFDELKQFDAARDHLEAAARLEPENVEVLTNLASTLTSLARYDEAEAILRRAQKVDADDLRVRTSMGILSFRRGRYDQAEMELRSVCARDSGNGAAFYYRGEALNRLGRYDDAVEALQRAAELLPNDPKPVYTLGHLYDRKHLPDEAAEMYRRARRLQKK